MRFIGVLLLSLAAATATAQQSDPDDLLKTAVAEQQYGDFPAAIRDYRNWLDTHPNDVTARVNLGAALVRVGQFDEGIAMYRAALPSLSFKNPVLLNLGLAYYKRGDFVNAHEQFEDLRKLEPQNVRVAVLLGDTDVKLGKPEQAIAYLSPLDAANPQNTDFQYVYGTALIAAGRRRDGAPRIEKVAESTNGAGAYFLAGATRLEMKEYEPARRDLEAAVRLDPKLPKIYTLIGTVRDQTGDPRSAELAFREALKINSDDFDANLYLGTILYKRRELDEAKLYLGRALKLKPQNFMARYQWAMLKSTSGEYQAAAQQLEDLVKDDPNWLDPHVQLASIYYKLRRPEDGARERAVVERITAKQQVKGPGKQPVPADQAQ